VRGQSTFIALALLASTSGCIVIPLPHHERAVEGSRQSVGESAANIMRSTTATRADVLFWLGEPDLTWDNDRVFVYRWTTSTLTILWAAGGGYQAAGGIEESPINNFVFIEFDTSGYVKRWEKRIGPWHKTGDDYTRQIWRTW
jgi:hypothetical protein